MSELFQTSDTYRSHKRIDEASPNASTNISDWQNESSGCTLLVGHVGQGQVSLGHADGQRTVALLIEKGKREKTFLCVSEREREMQR